MDVKGVTTMLPIFDAQLLSYLERTEVRIVDQFARAAREERPQADGQWTLNGGLPSRRSTAHE